MDRNAIVIGSGPNGLAAAIELARHGLQVEVREASSRIGGAATSSELTLPGFVHDLGSAVHPLAVSSPFLSELPLARYGLSWIWSPAPLAHPFDDGTAIIVERDIVATAAQFGADASRYRSMFEPLVEEWTSLVSETLRPLRLPHHPVLLARFGIRAFQPATVLASACFGDGRARALFAGLAAHSMLMLEAPLSSAFALILGAAAHAVGWPIPKGGSQRIANALAGVFESYGGRVVTNARVEHLQQLPNSDLTLCDITPRQFLNIAERKLSAPYRELLSRYRYGPGVFKMDWALSQPIPWKAQACSRAATVHLGGSLEEIAASERAAWRGEPPERPFVLLAQPSLFDDTRAPTGQHTAWAYCHVPNGYPGSAAEEIESQIERFAPGFRDCILARAAHTTSDMQLWNENLVGGDINGGAATLKQFVMRPTWRRYGTPIKGVYLCSSSTPPGGGVHGMCGYYAAKWALEALKSRE